MADYQFTLPVYVKYKGKKVAINLNWYRNCHYYQSNKVKSEFKEMIKPQFDGLEKIESKIHIKLVYYAARNNSPDLDNFTSVSKKFFQDAMVELGLIDDDNVNFIASSSEYYGGIDKANPRVEAFVTAITVN